MDKNDAKMLAGIYMSLPFLLSSLLLPIFGNY